VLRRENLHVDDRLVTRKDVVVVNVASDFLTADVVHSGVHYFVDDG
jgi:hypothetical protein